jgi:hypothetical protein
MKTAKFDKYSPERRVTIVTSVNGKPIHEIAPHLENIFEHSADAIKQVANAIGKIPKKISTKRIVVSQSVKSA